MHTLADHFHFPSRALALCGAIFFFLLSVQLYAEPVAPGGHSGTMHVRTADGCLIRHVPKLKTDVDIQVSGMLARVRVKQRFANPSTEWVEAIYVFSLPEDSAVDHMRMIAGDRVIEGEIKEKREAKQIYQQAKAEGKGATLLEQQRPNMFTTSLANVPPGEEVLVEIEYQQAIKQGDGVFALRFPMTVGPRYIPGKPIHEETTRFDASGWALATDQVPDAPQITPPVIDEKDPRQNRISLAINLNTGIAADNVRSLYHAVNIQTVSDIEQRIVLAEGDVLADRDFVLEWTLQGGKVPSAAFFQENWQGEHYGLLMVTPPAAQALDQVAITGRELILVVDTSGSMHGTSMQQAKAALHLALQHLQAGDRFNIIAFNHQVDALFTHAVAVNPANLRRAERYINGLEADGGTEMQPAMQYALRNVGASGLLRQVVFLTDGSIGNEEALFRTIENDLGDSRLFPVGIGSAPNSYFMARAAGFGRGSYTYIGDLAEVKQRMQKLLQRIAKPVLTGTKVTWLGEGQTEQAPQAVPDLYAGEPLQLSVKSTQAIQGVKITGMLGNQAWQRHIVLKQAANAPGVHVVWARRMIADYMAQRTLGNDLQAARQAIVDLGLKHHLVSAYTSLVAVDKTPIRPVEQSLHSKAVPNQLPQGWQQNKVFGQLPNTATPAQLYLISGLLLLLLSLVYYCREIA